LKAKLTVVDDPPGFRLSKNPPQLPPRQDGCEIQQRPRDGGTGNAVKIGSVRRRQAPVSMGDDSGWTATSTVGRHHMGRGIGWLPKTPKSRRRSMGENGVGPAREHSREEGRLRRRVDVTHGIDASMDSMKTAGALASGNSPSVHSNAFKLFQADQAMLPVGDPRDFQIPASRSKPKGRLVHYRSAMDRLV
jgi:hypothetical protein